MQEVYEQLLKEGINEENILLDEPMNKHTSFKTGGKADIFVKAYSIEEIKSITTTYFVKGNADKNIQEDTWIKAGMDRKNKGCDVFKQ